MSFFAFPLMTNIDMPAPRKALLVAGADAHSRYYSEDDQAKAPVAVDLVIVPGANPVDLYDRKDLIPFDRLDEFFSKNLAWPPSGPPAGPCRHLPVGGGCHVGTLMERQLRVCTQLRQAQRFRFARRSRLDRKIPGGVTEAHDAGAELRKPGPCDGCLPKYDAGHVPGLGHARHGQSCLHNAVRVEAAPKGTAPRYGCRLWVRREDLAGRVRAPAGRSTPAAWVPQAVPGRLIEYPWIPLSGCSGTQSGA
jgi:hypothetical protein